MCWALQEVSEAVIVCQVVLADSFGRALLQNRIWRTWDTMDRFEFLSLEAVALAYVSPQHPPGIDSVLLSAIFNPKP